MIARCLWPVHVCCHDPKEPLAQEKGKRCRTAHHLCTDQAAVGSIADTPMVACARLAADPQWGLAWSLVDAFQAACRAVFHDIDQGAARRRCHLRSEPAFAPCRWPGQERFVGCPGGKTITLKTYAWRLDTVVQQHPDQACQRCRSVAGGTNGAGVGRRQRLERIAEALPGLVDVGEGFDLEEGLD